MSWVKGTPRRSHGGVTAGHHVLLLWMVLAVLRGTSTLGWAFQIVPHRVTAPGGPLTLACRQRRSEMANRQPTRRQELWTGQHSDPSRIRRGVLLVLYLSDKNNNPDADADDDKEGAQLAAEFFQMAQKKGIRVEQDDLEDEDDDEDEEVEDDNEDDETEEEEEDEEEEPNIPQGAINAFLGYDTGNVGAKLAGNVSLTNEQLYSEVKERVLDTAGGFVDFVKRAQEDDDDDDNDDDDDDSRLTKEETKPYEAPTTVPDSDLTAGEVVMQVLDSLLHNNVPTPNRGVEILFGYSSPGSQIRNEVGLTPAEYADFLKETEYKILFQHYGAVIDKADYSFDGKKAFFTARLQASADNPLDTVSVNFILSTTGVEDDACWLVDSLLIRPQSMRRRRRR